jgi:hypothetical protein
LKLVADRDGWIRTRLRSKVRGPMARLVSRAKLPRRELVKLALVCLAPLARSRRLPPVEGEILGEPDG